MPWDPIGSNKIKELIRGGQGLSLVPTYPERFYLCAELKRNKHDEHDDEQSSLR